MISDATSDIEPYEAIIIHSRSRFFRDMFEFLNYERMLKRANCKIVSITQITSDDPAGEMASKIFSLFDEYQSKENGKHTLRAMKENARRGFINGSKPPYGYRAVEVDIEGAKGKKKVSHYSLIGWLSLFLWHYSHGYLFATCLLIYYQSIKLTAISQG